MPSYHRDHQVTTFILIRHGQSEWNRAGRFQGQGDSPLTRLGRAQAQRVAQRLRKEPVVALYSSDLSRAMQTAEIIGQTLGLTPIAEPRLREIDVGLWTGLTREEIISRFPEEWDAWIAGVDVARGGGETFVELQQRTVAALHDMAAAHAGQTIVAVTHGGSIRALLAYAQQLCFREVQGRFSTGNAAINVIQQAGKRLRVVCIGDATHLEGVEEELESALTGGD